MDKKLTDLDYYYEKQNIATRECLLALKSIILSIDDGILHTKKFQIPYFRFKEFSLGFLWVNKKKVLVGFVLDKKLLPPTLEKNKNNFTMLEINLNDDIPVEEIKHRFENLIEKYKLFSL